MVTTPRLLLVEDHRDTSRTLARLLQLGGYEVAAAGGVREALGLCEQQRFDLLISDIDLPDGTGHDLMRRVGPQYGLRGIAYSALGMPQDFERAREAGFSDYVLKPVSPTFLLDLIGRYASAPAVEGDRMAGIAGSSTEDYGNH